MERRWPKSERLLGFSETFLAARDHFFFFFSRLLECQVLPYASSSFRVSIATPAPGAPTLQQEVLYIPLGCFQPQTGPAKSESRVPLPQLLTVPTQLTHICGFRQGQVESSGPVIYFGGVQPL